MRTWMGNLIRRIVRWAIVAMIAGAIVNTLYLLLGRLGLFDFEAFGFGYILYYPLTSIQYTYLERMGYHSSDSEVLCYIETTVAFALIWGVVGGAMGLIVGTWATIRNLVTQGR